MKYNKFCKINKYYAIVSNCTYPIPILYGGPAESGVREDCWPLPPGALDTSSENTSKCPIVNQTTKHPFTTEKSYCEFDKILMLTLFFLSYKSV